MDDCPRHDHREDNKTKSRVDPKERNLNICGLPLFNPQQYSGEKEKWNSVPCSYGSKKKKRYTTETDKMKDRRPRQRFLFPQPRDE